MSKGLVFHGFRLMTALLNTRLTKGLVLFQGQRENVFFSALKKGLFIYLLICI